VLWLIYQLQKALFEIYENLRFYMVLGAYFLPEPQDLAKYPWGLALVNSAFTHLTGGAGAQFSIYPRKQEQHDLFGTTEHHLVYPNVIQEDHYAEPAPIPFLRAFPEGFIDQPYDYDPFIETLFDAKGPYNPNPNSGLDFAFTHDIDQQTWKTAQLGNAVEFTGRYAAACGPITFTRAVMRAPDFAYGTFRSFWEDSGGRLDGGWRLGTLPSGARLLATQESVSLAEVIRLVNKFSSNVMARQLLLTLGAEVVGRPGTTQGGRKAIGDLLVERGIVIPDLVLENGSGLSRDERITAVGLAEVLATAWRGQYMPEFAASLPLSATDGTLRRRFNSPEMQGRLRMKTGTLEGVSALAGYVNAASGRTYVAVIIVNHPGAQHGAGSAVQTALVQWVFGQ